MARKCWNCGEISEPCYDGGTPYCLGCDVVDNPSNSENIQVMNENPIMKYFAFDHLPEHLQAVSKPIGELAQLLDNSLPDGPEKSAGLRKLLEAKDCFVRAKVG